MKRSVIIAAVIAVFLTGYFFSHGNDGGTGAVQWFTPGSAADVSGDNERVAGIQVGTRSRIENRALTAAQQEQGGNGRLQERGASSYPPWQARKNRAVSFSASPGQTPAQSNRTAPEVSGKSRSNILLQSGTIDTRNGLAANIPVELAFDPTTVSKAGRIRYLVQFSGSVLPEWKKKISELGGELGDFIPENAFIVSMSTSTREAVGNLPYVHWVDYYHPAYKLSVGLKDADLLLHARRDGIRQHRAESFEPDGRQDSVTGAEDTVVIPENETIPVSDHILLAVQTFEGGRLPYLYNLIDSLEDSTVLDASDGRKSRVIVETKDETLNSTLIRLAQAADVEWIEPFVPPGFDNDQMHWVVQGNEAGSSPLWERGLSGSGQIVGIGDTGLDVDMAFFWDENYGVPGPVPDYNQRKVISYHDLAGNGDYDGYDHGTHVAGTVAGKSLGPNSEFNGIAFDAKLVIQDIGSGGSLTGIPADLNGYFQQAYDEGARIHSNSWGAAVGGAYTTYAQDADEFMWNNKDFLIVFSAGNSGPDPNTVGSPGTAKNVLTSGASENAHPGYSQDDVAYFSSNGPTDDGRIKPSVTAPGYYISSADNDGDITTFNSGVRTMSGTSMSAPAHAGSAALVRQYYMDGFYPGGFADPGNSIVPSAALIKATMINSAVKMGGEYVDGPLPGTAQGWGRILLENTLYFAEGSTPLFVDDFQPGLQTGEEQSYSFYTKGSVPLKISLVWTDHYPSLSAAVQLVNDLDLHVMGPAGIYKGNVFSGGTSVTGGVFDRLNVVENVFIQNPQEGAYSVTVSGFNVPSGPQPYALVITGLTRGSTAGSISFDKSYYQSDALATITLNDLDLNISDGNLDTAAVYISATNSPGQALILTETLSDSGTFQTVLAPNTLDGIGDGDVITVLYDDNDDGSGQPVSVSATAIIDDMPPVIERAAVSDVTEQSAVMNWQSNEPVTGLVLYRVDGAVAWSEAVSAENTEHSVLLSGLAPGTLYQAKIRIADRAGNVSDDDNNGTFYTFFTDQEQIVFQEDPSTGESRFILSGGSNESGENGLWHLTDYRSGSGADIWYYGLEETKTYETASRNWGTIDTVEGIDLSGLETARLFFRQILNTENFEGYDVARVQVSEDNETFSTVFQAIQSEEDWEEIAVDLTPYAGKTVFLRFQFDTVDEYFNDYEGWLLKDIRVVTYQDAKGDVNGDGLITLVDVLSALQVAGGKTPANPVVSKADINGDGVVGIAEALSALDRLSR